MTTSFVPCWKPESTQTRHCQYIQYTDTYLTKHLQPNVGYSKINIFFIDWEVRVCKLCICLDYMPVRNFACNYGIYQYVCKLQSAITYETGRKGN